MFETKFHQKIDNPIPNLNQWYVNYFKTDVEIFSKHN